MWAFGNGSGLNFNTTPVSSFTSSLKGLTPPYYVSSICDTAGKLLFYTNGVRVWNSNNIVLKRFKEWWPWSKNVMPLIVPYISNDSLYYLFGIDNLDDPDRESYKLQYLTIKMKHAGDVEEAVYPRPQSATSFYTTLLTNTSHVVAATSHCNRKDIWVTTHAPGALYSYVISKTGVDPDPVVTQIPVSVIPERKLLTKYGNIKFSANGEKLIIPDNDKIVVFDFNDQTGKFSNPIVLSVPIDQTLEDVEISADGSKLYFGSYTVPDPEVGAEVHFLYQMDLEQGSNAAIQKSLYQLNQGDVAFCYRSCYTLHRSMQLAPDDKIYIIRRDGSNSPYGAVDPTSKTLDVINDPSKAGIDANYQQMQVQLENVPKVINYNYVRTASFTHSSTSIEYQKNNCIDNPVAFNLIFKRIDSVKWDFGDPSTGTQNFSDILKPKHIFSAPGAFKVTAIVFNKCITDTIATTVNIEAGNAVHLPASLKDTIGCTGDNLALNATSLFATAYKWEDGSNSPERKIKKEGIYSITASNNCSVDRKSFEVSFHVCPCDLFIPNAFSPNSDGLNESYGPIFNCAASPGEYKFSIFDRFGQLVFQSNNPKTGWNGKNREMLSPSGVYVWTLRYKRPGINGIVIKKGTVTLLR